MAVFYAVLPTLTCLCIFPHLDLPMHLQLPAALLSMLAALVNL